MIIACLLIACLLFCAQAGPTPVSRGRRCGAMQCMSLMMAGQVATYRGGIPGSEHGYTLDSQAYFEKGLAPELNLRGLLCLGPGRWPQHWTDADPRQTGLFWCRATRPPCWRRHAWPLSSPSWAPGSCCLITPSCVLMFCFLPALPSRAFLAHASFNIIEPRILANSLQLVNQ